MMLQIILKLYRAAQAEVIETEAWREQNIVAVNLNMQPFLDFIIHQAVIWLWLAARKGGSTVKG
jgi:hypothetical protein